MRGESVKKNYVVSLIHFGAWLILLGFPLLFALEGSDKSLFSYFMFLVPMLFTAAMFYINYSILINHYLFQHKIWKFLLINLAIMIIFVIILFFIDESLFHKAEMILKDGRKAPPISLILLRNMFSLVMVSGLSVAIKMTAQWYKAESVRKDLEKAHVESELVNLKHQLSPHFFFNTLNNIYSLIGNSPENAQDAIHQLSKLIRYVLYETDQEFVPIDKEISFINNYIRLMSLRLPGNVIVETDIRIPSDDRLLAPLLFITLLENAFKHSVSPVKDSFIRIQLKPGVNNEVIFTVENSNHPRKNDRETGSGIGLSNLKKRLQLLYPSKHELVIEDRGKTFFAGLKIQV